MNPRIKTLRVYLYHRSVGTLTCLPGDRHVFAFDPDYLENPFRPILSLSFKDTEGNILSEGKITRRRLPPFFANLLPEGLLREYLANRAGIDPEREFTLLQILGQDLPGALRIEAEDDFPFFTEDRLATREKKKENSLRFSLAGIQLKFSALERADHGFAIPGNGVGGDWIIKLPHSRFPYVPENEYSMMELARWIGIDVPKTELIPLSQLKGIPKELLALGQTAFAIKRFDRTERGELIHIEDFAQVFDVYPEQKYANASYRNIAEVIWKEVGEVGILEFVRRFVFNALIGNGDMHLKNWSLIYRDPRQPQLAPAYDFVSTILYLPEDRLALNFVDSKDFSSLTIEQFNRFLAKAKLERRLVLDTVQETVESFSEAWKKNADLPLREDLKKAIDQHLKTIPFYK